MNEAIIQDLTVLGLTSSQARVFSALTTLEAATVKQIAQASKMDHAEVYRQLPSLMENGLIEEIIERPIKYKSIPTDDALALLLQRGDKANNDAYRKALKYFQDAPKKEAPPSHDNKTGFVILPKKEATINYTKRILDKAQNNVAIITPLARHPASLNLYNEQITKALARGVQFRVITDLPESQASLPKILQHFMKIPCFDIKFSENHIKWTFKIFDSKELVVFTAKPQGVPDEFVLWSNNSVMVDVFENCFEAIWNTSLDYKQRTQSA